MPRHSHLPGQAGSGGWWWWVVGGSGNGVKQWYVGERRYSIIHLRTGDKMSDNHLQNNKLIVVVAEK